MDTITIEGTEYEILQDAEVTYRSNIGRCQCLEPDNWWSMILRNVKTDETYRAWYYDDPDIEWDDPTAPDIDWDNPDDIEEIDIF